ncbi:MAG: hypothetical protein NZ898_12835 [Myxococcota bacterium]|nr:hypothetical protein [Myxococcota bacterium]MDW8362833.1 hypothetical protein [Myxococcales bacterium]
MRPVGRVLRVIVEIELGGRRERIEWVPCAHDGGETADAGLEGSNQVTATGSARASSPGLAAPSWPPPGAIEPLSAARSSRTLVSFAPPAPGPIDRDELALALDDLVTAVVRVGTSTAWGAPSVEAARNRIVRALGEPVAPAASRFLGRLDAALQAGDVRQCALLLSTAARLSDALGAGSETVLVEAWLGPFADGVAQVPIVDRRLIEVARERLPAATLSLVEQRLLVCPQSAERFVEWRVSDAEASAGPCPRAVHVSLARAESLPGPRALRLEQYAVQFPPGASDWEMLEAVAVRRFDALEDEWAATIERTGHVREPWVLVGPAEAELDDRVVLRDVAGRRLFLAPGDGTTEALAALARTSTLRWVAGRLVDRDGRLELAVSSAAVRDGRAMRLRRLAR